MSSSSQSFSAGRPSPLASPSQSHRFCATSSGGGSLDTLNRVIADLCSHGNPKEGASLAFRKHVEEAVRDLSGEASSRFMEQLYDRIATLIESSNEAENMGGLRAIDELTEIGFGENATNVSRFAGFMRTVLSKRDPQILVLASRVLGHLARAGGVMTSDEVEFQMKTAFDWLHGDRVEYRRFAAVLILKEMAENASTVFNVHVPQFVDAIWVALRDPQLQVRERAVEALRACLRVIEKRETRWRVQWYYRMFEATQDGLGRNAPVHSIHGSLLAVGELLRNTGEFMMSRYREVAEIVLRYLEHRDRLVRLSITSLLPRIAHFLRDRFVTNYLTICMNHILTVLKIPAERASGFIALGEMAGALDGELIHYLPTIMSHLREAIAPRKGRPLLEAVACVGNIAKAMGSTVENHVRDLLDAMFSSGLSSTLVDALDQITISIPLLLPTVQDRLLDCISLVLLRSQYSQTKPPVTLVRSSTVSMAPQSTDLSSSAQVQLALQTLARFNFKGHDLLEFARESVVIYLDDGDATTRKDAALCCCRLIADSLSGIAQFGSSRSTRAGGRRMRLVEEIVEKLLRTAVADADVNVRKSIFVALYGNQCFDDYLAQADSLTAIFASLNDEDLDVREYAISVAGRLSEKNPAYVLPALRRHLIQLLTYLEQSADNKCREESAKLLGCLVRNCERLILPYVAPVQKALVARLSEGTGVNANNNIVTGVLVTVGDLARVGGLAMRQYIPELMPLIVEALMDGAAVAKREVAVSTLGQVVQSTGYVVTPYKEYPLLLGLLLKLLKGDLVWSTRREVLKVLGIMGALDPHVHKRNQQSLSGSHGEVPRGTGDTGQPIPSIDELPVELRPSFATSEDYYSTVAINSLMRILRDPSLLSYHKRVVRSLMIIFKSMGLGCVPYLPKVLPELFHTVRTSDENLKDFITWGLGTLVSIVRQHIRKYLPELLSLVSELWSSFTLPGPVRPSRGLPVLHLLEHLCLALNDEFRTYLPVILPCFIQVLGDAERCNDYICVPDILHTLEVFGGTLDEHMHLLLPALIRLFKVDAPVAIRRDAIKTLTRVIPCVQVTGHISALVHHLKLVLDGKNDELRKDAVDALCCLAHALGEDFTIFIESIHKLLLKHRLRHKEFEEIYARSRRREPLIVATTATQQLSRRLPVEVIRDPVIENEIDPFEEGNDKNHQVNDGRLRTAGEASQRSTKEDWEEWMRHFSIELLKESPSPALRTCAKLAQLQPFVGRELFAAGFVSCWAQLNEASQTQLVRSLEMAFSSPNIPPEILATLLNLAEFMEHDEKPLPIDIRLLGALAEKCRVFAKALHYKEMEFEGPRSRRMDANPVAVVEALIHINNQLHQHEAAVGILTYAQQHLDVQLKESWYEKLQRWDDALKAYTLKASQTSNPHLVLEATLGKMRCLAALARWEELNNLCKEYWSPAEPSARLEMAPMAANAAWNMGEWDQMAEYVSRLDDGDETKLRGLASPASSGDGSSNGTFFRAVLLVRRAKYDEAREYVERARKCLATELAALVLESYERAYSNMVRVQQLSELEEVIEYYTLPVGNNIAEERRALIRSMWTQRIQGSKRNVEVWQSLLAVRALVLPPTEDVETWLKFASLCRKSGRISQAKSTLLKLLPFDPEVSPEDMQYHGPPQVMLGYLKYQWSLGEERKRKEAFAKLQILTRELSSVPHSQSDMMASMVSSKGANVPLLARVNLKLGTWQWALSPGLNDGSIQEILDAFSKSTIYAPKWAKAWHTWALFNTAVMSHYISKGQIASQFVAAAVTGYFHSIACAANAKGVDDSLQDILRLLTLWFNHGATADVQTALKRGFSHGTDTVSSNPHRRKPLYYHVFKRIDKQLASLTTLDLESVSPELLLCRDLELAVPGTYRADAPVVTIASFSRQLLGHEDLRQDERVMQLFGLVNTLLENSRKTAEKDLSIQRYSVIPLSPNSGLIGWVPNCDTLHHLIREYRDARKIILNQEHKHMLSFAPNYDNLPLIAKIEVFEYALENTEGNDLSRVLWLKSRSSEVWLERRTNYTRSLAVMSMVGYILGLGDRHPSNLMLDRYSGKILHIDFGDCFEASMNREKFPEKVPFRLTRMLVKAMEVSGIEGNFRSTCENVMQVLRTNKDSVMAMMEAFVHDPLINWRLFNFNEVPQLALLGNNNPNGPANVEPEEVDEDPADVDLPQPQRSTREKEILQAVNMLGDANEVLNERAVVVMARMSHKLTGRDFSTSAVPSNPIADHNNLLGGDSHEVEHGLSVKVQVQKLIDQATSHENLCQNYVGWCPFW
ncbi:BnaC05g50600D [Brassica napus]|uniref:Serine/threonine-protein kinase TOR n=1 Tax=Brassica napus TaxID=3708 RepID=A0A078I8R5_BRANA|nr:BnaC05g50600D [Brassica napus]